MDEGKNCPACGKDIGMSAIYLASWPTKIKCPHCRAVLAYDIPGRQTFLIVAFPMCALLYTFSLTVQKVLSQEYALLAIGLLFTSWIALSFLFEFSIASYWRKHKKLRLVKKPQ